LTYHTLNLHIYQFFAGGVIMRKSVSLLIVALMSIAMVSSVWAADYKEAPELAELVAAGKLPPVEERLPETPFVVGPGVEVLAEDLDWEVGKYGGVLTSVTANPELDWTLRDAAMENFIATPAHTTAGPIQPRVAEKFSMNEDATEFVFTLRKGLKWSDGVPVTTEDVRFAVEDVMMNEELTPTVPSAYRAGGRPGAEPLTLEIVDEYTFKVKFASPYGRFLTYMGLGHLWGSYDELMKPKHYLEKYHTKYTPVAEMAEALKEAGLTETEWFQLFHAKDIRWYENMRSNAPGFPTLGAWIRVESPAELMVFERNPYYWKVDTEGQQLPYVGRYESVIVTSPELIPVKVVAGEVNYNRDLIAHDKVALLKENEAKGGYVVNLDMVYHNAPVALFFNYNNPDETWQSVVLNEKFRHAVNYAMNRQAIIDAVFLGLGTWPNWFPQEYNVDKANALLDEMGMDKRDDEGYRLAPNGEKFELFIEVKEEAADWVRMTELLRADLEAVGIRTPLKQIEQTLWTARRDANELFASIDWLDDVNWPWLKFDYMPNERIRWGNEWHKWMNTNGADGVEPPAWMKDLYGIDNELRAVIPGTDQAAATEKRFIDWTMKYVPVFPLARDVVGPVILPPNVGNMAHSGKSSAPWFATEQVFFK
jgi:peptide/nickel transport system substrate-binding protein